MGVDEGGGGSGLPEGGIGSCRVSRRGEIAWREVGELGIDATEGIVEVDRRRRLGCMISLSSINGSLAAGASVNARSYTKIEVVSFRTPKFKEE